MSIPVKLTLYIQYTHITLMYKTQSNQHFN